MRAVLALAATALFQLLPAPAEAKRDLIGVGLTADQRLIVFDVDSPRRAHEIGAITGFSGDARLVGIDYRPATGALYGLGDAGGIYVVDTETAALGDRVQLSTPLLGTSFGVDFNPTVDRLRITSDSGQNLRVNVATGAALVDGDLNAPTVPPTPVTGVVAAAYTNNDADPNTATTLFDLDALLDQISIQAPPNAGALNPTGKLGVDAGSDVGFDIYSRLREGKTRDLRAFATIVTDGETRLYEVDLLTGEAKDRGRFKLSSPLVGLALPLDQF